MTLTRTAGGLLALAVAAALLTGCSHTTAATPAAPASATPASTGDGQLADMQQKVDSADSAATQAESDAAHDPAPDATGDAP